MKEKELMIGDKVMVKVLSQIPGTYVLHTWTANDYSRDFKVMPIPLTAKILEKNGWKHSNRLMITRIDDNDFYWYEELGGLLYKNQYNMCNCKYVHNLQQALRLCGLNELADKFKI